jgi:hypothetical protein
MFFRQRKTPQYRGVSTDMLYLANEATEKNRYRRDRIPPYELPGCISFGETMGKNPYRRDRIPPYKLPANLFNQKGTAF